MKNRIRLYRRQHNMTLKDLADSVGTTPQTISRLETEVMTLSADWLERLAQALSVHPTDLLDAPEKPDISLLGLIDGDGLVNRAGEPDRVLFEARGDALVAVRIGHAYGPYRAGEVLVGNRMEGDDIENALGRDSLCCTADGRIALRRVVRGNDRTYTLVPLEPGEDIRYNQKLRWAARIVLRFEHF